MEETNASLIESCPYEPFGCLSKTVEDSLEQHLHDFMPTHLSLVRQAFMKTLQENLQLKQQNRLQKRKIRSLSLELSVCRQMLEESQPARQVGMRRSGRSSRHDNEDSELKSGTVGGDVDSSIMSPGALSSATDGIWGDSEPGLRSRRKKRPVRRRRPQPSETSSAALTEWLETEAPNGTYADLPDEDSGIGMLEDLKSALDGASQSAPIVADDDSQQASLMDVLRRDPMYPVPLSRPSPQVSGALSFMPKAVWGLRNDSSTGSGSRHSQEPEPSGDSKADDATDTQTHMKEQPSSSADASPKARVEVIDPRRTHKYDPVTGTYTRAEIPIVKDFHERDLDVQGNLRRQRREQELLQHRQRLAKFQPSDDDMKRYLSGRLFSAERGESEADQELQGGGPSAKRTPARSIFRAFLSIKDRLFKRTAPTSDSAPRIRRFNFTKYYQHKYRGIDSGAARKDRDAEGTPAAATRVVNQLRASLPAPRRENGSSSGHEAAAAPPAFFPRRKTPSESADR